mmetsp:Transcript_15854/g.22076  ORF Transcript_15854/g.22076 Transcript_15854/m.22076 type:complete len:425 (-) Transcript_15854:662-1936(-)
MDKYASLFGPPDDSVEDLGSSGEHKSNITNAQKATRNLLMNIGKPKVVEVVQKSVSSVVDWSPQTLKARYQACMVLSAVGDAMGYHGAVWEFCKNGEDIHQDMLRITEGQGIKALHLKGFEWRVSDDTVMHLATAEALIECHKNTGEQLCETVAKYYAACHKDMSCRAPGRTTMDSIYKLDSDGSNWKSIQFSHSAGGCGAAMRAMCIGLRFWRPEQFTDLVQISLESGRITHHNPTGYLGAYVSALFTSYAIQGVPVLQWGSRLIDTVPAVTDYLKASGRNVTENLDAMHSFVDSWKNYLKLRKNDSLTCTSADFPASHNSVAERDKFYHSLSWSGWGGSGGNDATIIAYDSLLWSGPSWETLCLTGILHGGDNDSTGAIAGAWWGALYGFAGVFECNYVDLEYIARLQHIGGQLCDLFYPQK